jgi:hypothetical protein
MNDKELAAVKQALEALMVFRYAPPAQRPLVLKAITALQSIISQDALDWMAKNARELGLDYEPAQQEPVAWVEYETGNHTKRPQNCGAGYCSCIECVMEPAAQPAVQEPVGEVSGHDWSTGLLYRDLEPGTPLYTAPQPVPVKTYHDGKPWPVAPKPWVGLSEEEVEAYDSWADFQVGCGRQTLFDMVRDIESKLKGKNHV